MAKFEAAKESVRSQVTSRYVSKGMTIFVGLLSAPAYVVVLVIVTLLVPDDPFGVLVLAAVGVGTIGVTWWVGRTQRRGRRITLTLTVAAVVAACAAHETMPFWAVWRWTGLTWVFLTTVWVITIMIEDSTRDPRAVRGDLKELTADAGNPLQAVFAMAAAATETDPLKVKTTRTADRKIEGVVTLAPGENAERFLDMGGLADIESGADLPPGSLQGTASRTSRREVVVSLSDPMALDTPPMWPGPSRPGGSIAEPIHLGLFQTLDVCEIVATQGNIAITGTTGAGKDFGGAWNYLGEALTRRDVALFVNDPAKATQTFGPMASAFHVVDYSTDGGRALLTDLAAEIPRRTAWLADHDYASWREGCGLKYWLVFLSEFPRLAAAMDDDEWEAFKLNLKEIRSAGGRIVISLQDFHHSEVDDIGVIRGQVGRWTFGMMGMEQCKRSLTDRQRGYDFAPGGSPADWQASFPGRSLIDMGRMPEALVTVPLHTWNWGETDQERYQAMREHVEQHTHTHDLPDDEFTARVVAKAVARRNAKAAAPAAPSTTASTTAGPAPTGEPERERERPRPGDAELRAAGVDAEPGDDQIDTRRRIVSRLDPSITFPSEPDPEPTVIPEQAQRLLLDTISEWAAEGRTRFATADVRPVWQAVGYTRQWAQKHLLRLLDAGVLDRAGQEWIIRAGALEAARDRELVDA